MNKEAKQASYPHNMIIDAFGRDSEHAEEAINVFTVIIKKRCPTAWERYLCALNYYYRDGLSFKATGAKMNVSRERIRQIICKSLRLLRSDDVEDVLFPEVAATKDPNSIWRFNLNIRTANALRRYGVITISDIMIISPDEMLNVRGIGKSSIGEIMRIVGDDYLKKYWPELDGKRNLTILSDTEIYRLFKSYKKYEED